MLAKIVGSIGIFTKFPGLFQDRDNLKAAILLRNQFKKNNTPPEVKKEIALLFLERDIVDFKSKDNLHLATEILELEKISSVENAEKIKYLKLYANQPIDHGEE